MISPKICLTAASLLCLLSTSSALSSNTLSENVTVSIRLGDEVAPDSLHSYEVKKDRHHGHAGQGRQHGGKASRQGRQGHHGQGGKKHLGHAEEPCEGSGTHKKHSPKTGSETTPVTKPSHGKVPHHPAHKHGETSTTGPLPPLTKPGLIDPLPKIPIHKPKPSPVSTIVPPHVKKPSVEAHPKHDKSSTTGPLPPLTKPGLIDPLPKIPIHKPKPSPVSTIVPPHVKKPSVKVPTVPVKVPTVPVKVPKVPAKVPTIPITPPAIPVKKPSVKVPSVPSVPTPKTKQGGGHGSSVGVDIGVSVDVPAIFWKSGSSSSSYLALQVRNADQPILSVAIKASATISAEWQQLERTHHGFWEATKGYTSGPRTEKFDIRVVYQDKSIALLVNIEIDVNIGV